MGVDAPGTALRHLIQMPRPFPLDNPAIVSAPLGFLAAIAVTLAGRDPEAEAAYSELNVRARSPASGAV
jgi:hypothetical protein